MALSKARADAAFTVVNALGSALESMDAEVYGPQLPVATNDTEKGHA